ncbi:MAG: ketoacyl-ACP synthase III [Mesorhizobium sp.]
MIAISTIASYVPSTSIDNLEQGKRFGEDEEFILKKIGARRLPVLGEGEETSDLACAAVRELLSKSGLGTSDVDALVVVTQNGDGAGLPHTSAIVHAKLGLSADVAAFDISLGCSGYVYGLSVIKGLMEQAGLSRGILVTADPYSKIVSREDRSSSLLFGDAATATLLSADGEWNIGAPIMATDGSGAANIAVANGKLNMNGRQVFAFAANKVAVQIRRCLSANGLNEDQIDLFCLHQGSAFIVNTIARQFPNVQERFVLDMAETGNTVSSSIPIILEKHLSNPENRKVLISGFGVGLSWATNLLTRKD